MGTKRPGKEHLAQQNTMPQAPARRGYRSWSTQMDVVLTATLFQQINEGNKGDGDFKQQALQAVVDNLKTKLNISLTPTHVRNRIKTWKTHYSEITDIRNYTKFRWDEDRKMLVIPVEELEDWQNYCKVLNSWPFSNISHIVFSYPLVYQHLIQKQTGNTYLFSFKCVDSKVKT